MKPEDELSPDQPETTDQEPSQPPLEAPDREEISSIPANTAAQGEATPPLPEMPAQEDASPTLPETLVPTQRGERQSIRGLKVLIPFVALVCVIGGICVFIFPMHSSPSMVNNPANGDNGIVTPTWSRSWCAPAASSSSNFSSTSISGLTENDVWSIGTQITHWDGHSWQTVFSPTSSQETLHSIIEIAPDDVWAVGEQLGTGLPSHTFTLHWTGKGWQRIPNPDAATEGKNTLVAISGTSTSDIWAVGFFVPRQGSISPLIEHWNGSRWSITPHLQIAGSAQFTSVKMLANNNVWAVGYQYALNGQAHKTSTQPIIEHWDGHQWSLVKNPDLNASGGGNLYNIGGSSAHDLWAVGSSNNSVLMEHWDGHQWSLVASPTIPQHSGNWLASVTASALDNAWAVGRIGEDGNKFQPLIEHWDGHQWQISQAPTQGVGELDIAAMVGHQLWIVGLPDTSGGHAFIEALCA